MKYFQLLRVKQYLKNLFIFLPTFFAGEILDFSKVENLLYSFFSFSFIASSIYILNDIKDVEEDRLHPKKSKRVIASGLISPKNALLFVPVLILASLSLAYKVNNVVVGLILVYFITNLLYTYYLKKIAILDIVIVASFFLLRIYVGGFATDIVLSKWIVLMVFLLSLGLVLGKRYDDLILAEKSGNLNVRSSLKGYSLEFTKLATLSVFIISVMSYIMYSVSPEVEGRLGSQHVFLTSIPVLIGVLRYLNIMMIEQGSGSPTEVLIKDRFIQLTLLIWVVMLGTLYYIK